MPKSNAQSYLQEGRPKQPERDWRAGQAGGDHQPLSTQISHTHVQVYLLPSTLLISPLECRHLYMLEYHIFDGLLLYIQYFLAAPTKREERRGAIGGRGEEPEAGWLAKFMAMNGAHLEQEPSRTGTPGPQLTRVAGWWARSERGERSCGGGADG